VSGETVATVVEAQHGPGGAAHLIVLAALVVVALAIFGVKRWRERRAAAMAEQPPAAHDQAAGSTQPTEKN
jgi:uncharacterized iron-regulated membrane protein